MQNGSSERLASTPGWARATSALREPASFNNYNREGPDPGHPNPDILICTTGKLGVGKLGCAREKRSKGFGVRDGTKRDTELRK
jgi:hypothetical protein